MEKVKRFSYKAADIVAWVSIAGYVVIALLSVADIISIKAFDKSITGSYEIIERLMLISVFSSFAYAQTKKAHINMPILVERMPRTARCLCLTLMGLLSIAIAVILAYAAFRQTGVSYTQGTITGMIHIPLYPFFLIEGIAMAFFSLILIIDTYFALVSIKKDSYHEELIKDYGMNIKDPENINRTPKNVKKTGLSRNSVS